ncbi:hypothetical protein BCR34DRAFT_239544 [Clohesyomyces aquaticus]|uniref:C2H2-type domain-containing protein n=1 Tax=Clohesyomyces aquaticus TaxID=1231657 RepID=A0A1Y1Y654_9PLEO|nr:hypothetical protein BCR34DRAFT_239544 [Clohesyomyces aquaticus]
MDLDEPEPPTSSTHHLLFQDSNMRGRPQSSIVSHPSPLVVMDPVSIHGTSPTWDSLASDHTKAQPTTTYETHIPPSSIFTSRDPTQCPPSISSGYPTLSANPSVSYDPSSTSSAYYFPPWPPQATSSTCKSTYSGEGGGLTRKGTGGLMRNPVCLNPPHTACEKCDKQFTGIYRSGNLRRHYREMHPDQREEYNCRVCNVPFKRADAQRKHEWKQHKLLDVKPKKRVSRMSEALSLDASPIDILGSADDSSKDPVTGPIQPEPSRESRSTDF